MQPYFFPYIGYFQLIAHSDVFVVADDVQYIKGGWVNRNRLRREGHSRWITLPVVKGAHELAINQRFYQLENVGRALRQVEDYYRGAPNFDEIFPLLRDILTFGNANVASFNLNVISWLATRLNIQTHLILSSELKKDKNLAAQERVVNICKKLGASCYVNPIGGQKLYQHERFGREGIKLGFLEPQLNPDPQMRGAPFSIIDTLMFNNGEAIAGILKKYRIITTGECKNSIRSAETSKELGSRHHA